MQKLVAEVLTVWRSAERLAAELSPDDPIRPAVLAASEQLQATFNELTIASGISEDVAGIRPSEVEEALRETSKDIAADVRRLHSIENTKRRVHGDDERLVELSMEAKELSVGIAAKAQAELNLAKETAG